MIRNSPGWRAIRDMRRDPQPLPDSIMAAIILAIVGFTLIVGGLP